MCPSKIQSHKLYQFSILLGVSLSEVNFASCQFYDRIILWQSFYTRVYLWNYRSINIPVKIFFANSLSKPHRKNPFNWSKVKKNQSTLMVDYICHAILSCQSRFLYIPSLITESFPGYSIDFLSHLVFRQIVGRKFSQTAQFTTCQQTEWNQGIRMSEKMLMVHSSRREYFAKEIGRKVGVMSRK